MPAEVTQRADGTYEAAFAFTPPWWKSGTVVDCAPDGAAMQKLAKIDWLVEQCPAEALLPDGNRVRIPGVFANVRADTHDVLGTVSERYKLLQNHEAFDFVDALHQDGILKYESAGSLKGGKIVWLLARIPGGFTLGNGDENRSYVLFANGFYRGRAIRCFPTAVRVQCWNTMRLAYHSASATEGFSIAHSGDLKSKLTKAIEVMQFVKEDFKAFERDANILASRSVKAETVETFINQLIPEPDDVDSQNAKTRCANSRAAVIQAFNSGPQLIDGIRGTAWAMLNAFTQYIDHDATRRGTNVQDREDNRMLSTMMTHGALVKQEALKVALALTR